MIHHPAPQGVASSPTDNLVRRFPRIFYSVQLFLQAFALNMKMLFKVNHESIVGTHRQWPIVYGYKDFENVILLTF